MNNLSLFRRIVMIMGVAAIQLVYVPTSQNGIGGVMPKLSLDVFPVYPIWVTVYVLCFPLWFFCIFWAIRKMEARLFLAFIIAAFITVSAGIAIFILFPTYVDLPQVDGADFFSGLLRQVQVLGGQYNALPSGHLYITTLFAFFFAHWYPRTGLLWAVTVFMVGLSTLFTGQHYILDVLSGIAVAWLGYRFGLWWVGRKMERTVTVE